MKPKKISLYSNQLNRNFHFDTFYPNEKPVFQILFFGGSGITKEEYLRRSKTVATIFNPYLNELEKELHSTPFDFNYITAPFDINFHQLSDNEELQDTWQTHIKDELLPHLTDVPIYWIGYSGGFLLGWYGLLDDQKCFGAGILGGDQLSDDVYWPSWWREELRLYYNTQDAVFSHNKKTIQDLTLNEEAKCFRALPGTHRLTDYLRNESFGGLIRWAAKLYM